MAKNVAYVVWAGRVTGVFNSWPECENQVKGFKGAKFKGFASQELANHAASISYEEYQKMVEQYKTVPEQSVDVTQSKAEASNEFNDLAPEQEPVVDPSVFDEAPPWD